MVLHTASIAFCAFGRSLYKTQVHIESTYRKYFVYILQDFVSYTIDSSSFTIFKPIFM